MTLTPDLSRALGKVVSVVSSMSRKTSSDDEKQRLEAVADFAVDIHNEFWGMQWPDLPYTTEEEVNAAAQERLAAFPDQETLARVLAEVDKYDHTSNDDRRVLGIPLKP